MLVTKADSTTSSWFYRPHRLDSKQPLALPSAGYRCRPMLSKLAMTDGIAAMLVALAANQPPQPHITESIQLPEALVP